jgi:translation initiation factor 1A
MYYSVFLSSNNSFLGTYTNIRLGSFYKLLEFFRGINTNIKRSFLPDYSDYHVVQGHIWKTKMGKHKVTNEGNLYSMVLPSPNDVLGIAVKMLGAERIMVKCQDGKERLCRIRGKLKRRVWIREGDIVLVSPWDFQFESRGDIFRRYRKNQSDWLRNYNYLTM